MTALEDSRRTVGDEWRGLANDVAGRVAADLRFRRLLHPLRFASGIGVGRVATPMAKRAGERDVPRFHHARAALDSIIRPTDRAAIGEFRRAGLADGGR